LETPKTFSRLVGGHRHVLRKRAARAPQNAVAGLENGDTFAHRMHLAGAIGARGVRHVRAVQADACEDLAAVERCSAHAYQDFAALRLRHRRFARLEHGFSVDGFDVVALHIVGSGCE
jgi:hypothetical protein